MTRVYVAYWFRWSCYEAGRALRAHHAPFELGDVAGGLIVDPAVAAGFLHPYVEPDRRIEAGLLGKHEVGQFGAKVFTVFRGLEVTVLISPAGDVIDHAFDQLGHAGFTLRAAQLSVEVLAGDDIGGGLRPIRRDHHIALLEEDRAFIVADGSGARLPADIVIGGLIGFEPGGEIAGERNPGLRRCLRVQNCFYFRKCNGRLAHRKSFPPEKY